LIGLQDLIIKQNIKVIELAKEINLKPERIWSWFKNNKIPNKHLKILSERFNVEEDYLNKQVNNINTYKPRAKGFNIHKVIDEITEIYVTRKDGTEVTFQIDTEELHKLIKLNYCWSAVWDEGVDNYYAASTHYYKDKNGKTKQETILLTEVIMNYKPIDHINNDTKNNRKVNLRKTNHETNGRNRRGKNTNNSSGYRNVSWNGSGWSVQIQINKKNTTLKRFSKHQLEEAGKFAEEMRIKYYGEFAGKS